jgi:cytochrome c556
VRLATAWAILLCACASVLAASGVIGERKATMKLFPDAVRTMGEMFRGTRPYDQKAFKAAAETIRSNSGAALREKFPPGSVGEGSQARPEIFVEWAEFTVRSDQMELLAAALSHAADGAPHGIGDDMRMGKGTMMGGSLLGSRAKPLTPAEIAAMPAEHAFHLLAEQCTACHAKFRFRDE